MRHIARRLARARPAAALFLTCSEALIRLFQPALRLVAAVGLSTGDSPVNRLIALIFAVLAVVSGQALAQGEIKGKYGDWDLRCDTPPGAQNQQCVIMQFVTAEDRENVGLSVVV